MQLQGWAMFHPIMNFFDVSKYKIEIVDYFFKVARDWHAVHADDAEDIVTSRMPECYAWYDMSVGFRALVIAFFANRISYFNIEISNSRKTLLLELSRKHIAHLSCKRVFYPNNHGLFQMQGLVALLNIVGRNSYSKEYKYAMHRVEELIDLQFDKNGVHLEHSPHYHFYALNIFKNLLANEWYSDMPALLSRVKKAERLSRWLVDPEKKPACIGDSVRTEQKHVNFNKPIRDALAIESTRSKLLFSDFDSSGYCVARSEWQADKTSAFYLFVMGMYWSKAHKHRDCMSFEWFDLGRKIICDGGKYGYVSDKFRTYFLSYKAHNNLQIEGFDILRMRPYGSCIKPEAEDKLDYHGVHCIKAELKYKAFTLKRRIIFEPGKWLIVIDFVALVREKEVTQRFTLSPSFKLIKKNNCGSNNLLFLSDGYVDLYIKHVTPGFHSIVYYGDPDLNGGYICEHDYSVQHTTTACFSGKVEKKMIPTIFAFDEDSLRSAERFLDKVVWKDKRFWD